MDFPVQMDSALDNLQPSSYQSSEFAKAASSTKGPDEHSSVINSSYGSKGSQNLLISDASNLVPDEQSPAVGHNSALSILGSWGNHRNQTSISVGLEAKGKADTKYSDGALLESSSLCSLAASNNRNVCSRKHDGIDYSKHLSDNGKEAEDVVKEKPAREGTGVKRSRNSEVHNLCERKRRDKINKRIRILKELIPNCNKTDKASMLDDAIEYLKTLKLQLEIMSMGGGFCMPLMMLPNASHLMIKAPHLHQLMGVGMGLRPGTTIPMTPLPAITDNRAQMFHFPNQVPTMHPSHAPFIPMVGNPCTQTPLATGTATNMAENLPS
ncbi:hypothetical protein PHAVU_007G208500 [Phaseolus vulgaris]|uniref:BHLH domain-containing protein n=1 Tax=Phaseolus vulgaris TaxID=3885 RepID=V7BHT4_PHAVU|nr:hypothetical protein PHAVU_007G208500g [Phaseolus vulgaris]ESW17080.1 hypothetical protein PHAVU_007G208500g [Phaseolus vulgaris]